MTETLAGLLLRLSEAGEPAFLWGRQAAGHAGPAFERLLARGVLIEQAPATEWDVCPACDCGLESCPIEQIEGRIVALCPTDRRSDVVLDSDDLRSFRISAAAIAGEIALVSGFADTPSQVMPGVWYVGMAPTKRSLFIVLARDSVLAPALIAALRAFEPKLPITLVGPSVAASELLRFVEAGVCFVPTTDAFATSGETFALDPRKIAPLASVEPRLTLFQARSMMVFEGDELELAPISFKLLWFLAERAASGEGMATRAQIEEHLWATVVSKTAVADAIRNLRDALKKMGKKGESNAALVRTLPTQGYILDLAASDIRLMD